MILEALKAFAFTGGAWVIYILIFCSVLSIAVIVERWIVLRRERLELEQVHARFHAWMQEGASQGGPELESFRGLPARVLQAGIANVPKGVPTVEESMDSIQVREKRRLEARMIILNTLGSNAVYIGLFGTVLGVIKAFRDLAQESGAGPEVVMQGLSEALIATAVGLLVAIPCVVAYNVLSKQIRDVLSETDAMAHFLLARLKSEEKR